jgi:hypothetical protein
MGCEFGLGVEELALEVIVMFEPVAGFDDGVGVAGGDGGEGLATVAVGGDAVDTAGAALEADAAAEVLLNLLLDRGEVLLQGLELDIEQALLAAQGGGRDGGCFEGAAYFLLEPGAGLGDDGDGGGAAAAAVFRRLELRLLWRHAAKEVAWFRCGCWRGLGLERATKRVGVGGVGLVKEGAC